MTKVREGRKIAGAGPVQILSSSELPALSSDPVTVRSYH